MTKPMAASTEVGRLSPFVGVWDTEGEVKAGPAGKPARFKATDTYEWLPGGHFLLHFFNANMPEGNVQGIEVIGYSRQDNAYPMHSFDSLGNANVMQARVTKDTWTFIGEGVRFTGGFRDDGKVFAGVWEKRSNGGTSWQPWMEVSLRRVE